MSVWEFFHFQSTVPRTIQSKRYISIDAIRRSSFALKSPLNDSWKDDLKPIWSYNQHPKSSEGVIFHVIKTLYEIP